MTTFCIEASAANQIARLQQKQPHPVMLRVYIVGGGCSGFQYGFSFEKAASEDDQQFQAMSEQGDRVSVVIDPMSLMYLTGATLKYISNLRGSYFNIQNPNAQTTCSCGASFSV